MDDTSQLRVKLTTKVLKHNGWTLYILTKPDGTTSEFADKSSMLAWAKSKNWIIEE